LDERLAQDYRVRTRYEQHFAHQLYPFERFVMNGGAPADVYELKMNSAPAQSQIGQSQAE
jgi:hypothetical protein